MSRQIIADANATPTVPQPLRDGTLRKHGDKPSKSTKELVEDHASTASTKIPLVWGHNLFSVPDAASAGSLGAGVYPGYQTNTKRGYVQSETRDLIIKRLYPRTLYGFSDVVCFVTNNSRFVVCSATRVIRGD